MNTINHLVITAAGQGTRMKPANPRLPKEMLAIGNKPAIQYSVEEGISAQIKDIIIIINRNKEIIREYFGDEDLVRSLYPQAIGSIKRIKLMCKIRFAYQDEPKGEVDAIYQAKEMVGRDPFAVMYPDDIHLPSGVALRTVCKSYEEYESNIVALTVVNRDNAHLIGNSGKVDLDKITGNVFRINRFIPKTKGSFRLRYENELKACGLMVFCGNIFRYISEARTSITTNEYTDIQLREEMMKDNTFLGCKLTTDFFDIGNPLGYQECLGHIQTPS